jgi:transcriptional regulator with XRE-family HTH domain
MTMHQIKPDVLRKLREAQKMTLERLKDESGVPIGTINKIEKGKRSKVQHHTIQRLAHALKVNVEVLEGSSSADDSSLKKLNLSSLNKSELSVIIDDRCRNALQLVAWRYKISSEEILNLAPFLFFWAAEKSLKSRNEALDQIEDKFREINSIRNSTLPHINVRIGQNMVSEEIISLETKSIEKRDLFGQIVEEESDDFAISIREDYDESEHNPFTGFLKAMANELPGRAEFEWMYSSGSPHYEICRDVALKLVGGDEEGAEALLSGRAPLHLLPKNLFSKDKAQERAEWAKAEAQKHPGLNLEDLL